MACEFKMTRRVEFHETDMAGIVHFSNFFRYMEETEHSFFRSLGVRLHAQSGGRMRGFARVNAECRYLAPLRYFDDVDVHLRVTRVGRTSLSYRFDFHKVSEQGAPCEATRVGTGALSVVYVTRSSDEDAMRPTELEADLRSNLSEAPDAASSGDKTDADSPVDP